MFTGIIEAIGTIRDMQPKGGDLRLTLAVGKLDMSDVALGDSIAVNGVCLTVLPGTGFQFFVSAETLSKTNLGALTAGRRVNCERALRVGDSLSGHMVQGHVDGIGTVTAFDPVGESRLLQVNAPAELSRYLAHKGSITVNGVSLTVNRVTDEAGGHCRFEINLIAHTLQHTALNTLRIGAHVNLEIDLIARYVERMLSLGADQPGSSAFSKVPS